MKIKNTLLKAGLFVFPFSLSLPVDLKYSSIALIFLLLMLLINLDYKKARYKSVLIIFSMFFFLIDAIVPIIFLEFDKISFNETKLSYLFIPILFLNSKILIKENLKLIFKAFVFGVLLYVFYAWGYAFYFYNIKYPEWYNFSLTDNYILYMFYNYLPGAIHHTYIGLYLLFAISILLKTRIMIKGINFSNFLIVILSFSIFYIGGKVTMLLLFLNFFLYFLYNKRINVRYLLFLICSATIGLLFVKDWIIYSFNNSLGKRISYYECGFRLLKNNYLKGVGFKNIKLLASKCSDLEIDAFIPHNSLLYEIMANGVLGFILLIIIYILLITLFFKSKNIILNIFIFNILVISLIEDVFYLQRGVLFIITFLSLLYLKRKSYYLQ